MATFARGARLSATIGALALLFGGASAQAETCVGDCNGDNMVAINELIIGVNIALGSAPVSECPSFDVNGDGMVTVNELIQGVNNALNGCPAPGNTPTVTATVSADTPTATETVPAVDTPTATSTVAVDTPTPTETPLPTATATQTVVGDTPTATETVPAVDTPTATSTVAVDTPTPTETPLPTATATQTVVGDTPTATETVTPTATSTVAVDTPTPTETPLPSTPTATATPTDVIIGEHACTLVTGPGMGEGTTLFLQTQALPLTLSASGSLLISCGSIMPDGKAACDCNVTSFDPVVIPAIGDVCVNPAAGCPQGEIDCDGGNAMDTDLKANHNIGNCESNAECSTACDTVCDGFGPTYTQISSGCEGYCLGGANNEAACTQDTGCPGGTCVGANPPAHSGVCGCVCGGTGLGGPSPAGSMSCNIGVQIDVELPSNGACGDPATIVLAPQCGAVTTTTATGQIVNANNTTGKLLPVAGSTLTGAGIDCSALTSSTTGGLRLVGSLAFFDSTLGDIHSGNVFQCE